jgi:hypothetical protein
MNKSVIFVLKNLTLSIIITALAGLIAMHITRDYFAIEPFHCDSSSYLYNAIQSYDLIHMHGRFFAFIQAIQEKDFLDLVLRILIAPSFLQKMFGHMFVLLPFMGLYISLLIYYVYQRTQAFFPAIVTVSFLFCFPLFYSPYMGIADYWKESIAIWILGGTVISWLLSDMLNKPKWALLSGGLFGLLMMERSALAVYMALLFIPLVLLAMYLRLRQNGMKQALIKASFFVIPAVVMCGIVVLLQWKVLYIHYFVAGYAYAPPAEVFKVFSNNLVDKFGFSFTALIVFYVIYFMVSVKQTSYKDLMIALWMVIGFPVVVIFCHTLYFGVYNTLTILLTILLGVLMPAIRFSLFRSLCVTAIFGGILYFSAIQYHHTAAWTQAWGKPYLSWHNFYEKVTAIFMAQSKPVHYSLLFDEAVGTPFVDHARFYRGIAHGQMVEMGFVSVHDNSYKAIAETSDFDIKKSAEENLRQLESNNNTLVITYCDSKNVSKSPAFGADAVNIAIPMITLQTSYIQHSPHWKALAKLDSPRGCLYVYQYSKTLLSAADKWKAVLPSLKKRIDA